MSGCVCQEKIGPTSPAAHKGCAILKLDLSDSIYIYFKAQLQPKLFLFLTNWGGLEPLSDFYSLSLNFFNLVSP